MSRDYQVLPARLAPAGTVLMQPGHQLQEHVSVRDPAIDVMTDLTRTLAATVNPDLPVINAEERMRNSGVRLLFVVNTAGDLLGLITLTDIKGERPVRFQRERGVSHDEVLVCDIMTPRDRLEALSMEHVATSRVGDIIETLKRTGRQHALVITRTAKGPAIRGIFSATRIGRQLGVRLDTSGIAWTFAELEAALTH
ncbi:MAG: CBS domain-containing protein [Gammaproteobacteria bacterium]|nr:CBS domain-containing protein [Gammaproteobacteria bacterium]